MTRLRPRVPHALPAILSAHTHAHSLYCSSVLPTDPGLAHTDVMTPPPWTCMPCCPQILQDETFCSEVLALTAPPPMELYTGILLHADPAR